MIAYLVLVPLQLIFQSGELGFVLRGYTAINCYLSKTVPVKHRIVCQKESVIVLIYCSIHNFNLLFMRIV